MKLDIKNQEQTKDKIKTEIDNLISSLEKRGEIWDKIPIDKKKIWINSNKDPIMSMSWDLYKKLNKYFGILGEDDDS